MAEFVVRADAQMPFDVVNEGMRNDIAHDMAQMAHNVGAHLRLGLLLVGVGGAGARIYRG